MIEVTVTLTESEAEALLPQNTATLGVEGWNARQDHAEDAQAKIRAAMREERKKVEPMQGQAGLAL